MAKVVIDRALVSQQLTALTVRGVAAVLFGLVALFWPGLTLVTLVYVFSAFVVVSGVIGIVMSIVEMPSRRWWYFGLALSLVELGVGVYLVRHIDVSLATFLLLAGVVLVVRGVVDVVMAVLENATATKRVLNGLVGVFSLVVGLVVLRQPVNSGLAFVWLLGFYALVAGPLLIALSVDARKVLDV